MVVDTLQFLFTDIYGWIWLASACVEVFRSQSDIFKFQIPISLGQFLYELYEQRFCQAPFAENLQVQKSCTLHFYIKKAARKMLIKMTPGGIIQTNNIEN